MSAYGFHKLIGAGSKRFKANLCPRCVHLLQRPDGLEFCRIDGKWLTYPESKKGKCEDCELEGRV